MTGATLPALFENAALACTARLVDLSTVQSGALRDRIRLEAPNRETLLAAWVNQIQRLFVSEREFFNRFRIRRLTEGLVEAEVEGELLDPGRHRVVWRGAGRPVGVALRETPAGFEAVFTPE